MNLVNNDLWASANYLSEMASNEMIINEDYQRKYTQFVKNGADLAVEGWDGVYDYSRSSWYISPEPSSSQNYISFMG